MEYILVISFFVTIIVVTILWFVIVPFWKKSLKTNYKVSYPIITTVIIAPIVFFISAYIIALVAFSQVTDWN